MALTPFIFFLLFFFPFSIAQQGYLNNAQNACYATNLSTTLGYSCNSISSCQSYLTFRPASIPSSHLNLPRTSITTPSLSLIPTTCSCSGPYYQHNTSFTITTASDTYLLIANDTYSGLTTCQALIAQNPTLDSRHLLPGGKIVIPLRCACPTAKQATSGAKYLLTYIITYGDDVPTIAARFGADYQSVLDANGLTANSLIYPFTSILVPIDHAPTKKELLQESAAPPDEAPPAPVAASGTKTGSNKKWVGVGVGVGVGILVISAIFVGLCCLRRQRRKPLPQDVEKVEVKRPEQKIDSDVRKAVDSLAGYEFHELEKATGGFDEKHRIKEAVYRAEINGDNAVIKCLKGDVSEEIGILRRINHSNIIRLSGYCIHDGSTYLVYEYAEKGSLSEWIHRKELGGDCLGWKQRVQIAYDVAEGLNYLHNYANPTYVHKDLRSSNVLLDGEFRAKVSDFGLARSVEVEDEEMQLTRHVVGTQGYMAPEYLEHGLISNKMDVFAFGVVMLELLSGKEATFVKDGEAKEKGGVLLWTTIESILSGEDVQSKLRGFIDPCLEDDYPFDLAFAVADLARRCVERDLGLRPAVEEVLMSLSAIYNSTLDWDPSDFGNSGSMHSYGR